MFFAWLKRYMPRGLYGRAALILVLPVVTLQLVVSVVFIQRHFEGVTEQMTRSVSRELRLVLSTIEAAPTPDQALVAAAAIAGPLSYDVAYAATTPATDLRRWYDFSGIVVIRTLRDRVPEVTRILLPDEWQVEVFARTRHGVVHAVFDRDRMSASNPHQLLVNMIVFGVLMTAVAFIYLRNQLRPITRLAHAAEAFGRGRTLPYQPSGAIEVRAAGKAFLDMRARIDRQIEQRTMMLSGVSHDLRTPLTRLRLGLAMLDDDAERALLLRDVDDMQRLLDEFLDFARGEAEGTAQICDPLEVIADIVADARREGKKVALAEAEGSGQMMLRPMAIRRAVENLVGNAVRYGTRAEVSVRLTEKALRIRVEDDGPGIPPESREEALKPFARLDPARNQDKGSGVGLGLAIAADVARAHGGVLRLERSERLGGLMAEIMIGR